MKILPTPAIQAHRLWNGSMEELELKYSKGTDAEVIAERCVKRERSTDLTASEVEWNRLWRAALKDQTK